MGMLAFAYPPRAATWSGLRVIPAVPRAADPGTGPRRAGERADGDLAERPATAAVPSLDELPDRAVVRPGERGDHGQREFLARAYTSPVTSGSCSATWSATGTVGAAWLLARVSRGRIRPPVGLARSPAPGPSRASASSCPCRSPPLAFHGSQLAEAKVGVLSAAMCASVLGWVVSGLPRSAETATAPRPARHRRDHHRPPAVPGRSSSTITCAARTRRGHARGSGDANAALRPGRTGGPRAAGRRR